MWLLLHHALEERSACHRAEERTIDPSFHRAQFENVHSYPKVMVEHTFKHKNILFLIVSDSRPIDKGLAKGHGFVFI